MSDLNSVIENSMQNIFVPTFLKTILIFLIPLFIFLIIRTIFSKILKKHRAVSALVDGILVLALLAFLAFYSAPSLANIKLPSPSVPAVSDGYDPFSMSESEAYSGSDPFSLPSQA